MKISARELSWGRLYDYDQDLRLPYWPGEVFELIEGAHNCGVDSILPGGLGRSYGDSCLNREGILLEVPN